MTKQLAGIQIKANVHVAGLEVVDPCAVSITFSVFFEARKVGIRNSALVVHDCLDILQLLHHKRIRNAIIMICDTKLKF